MRPATAVSYRSAVETHIVPAIGAMKLERLTPAVVQRFYADLREDGVGDRTRQKVHAVLHRALASAVRLQLLQSNPAALDEDAPKYRAPEREPLTLEQARALLDAAKGDPFEALYVLALTTGARQGELFALRWRDVDLAAGTLRIARTVQDVDTRGTLQGGPTKTSASRRRIELSPLAIEALERHREKAPPASANELIFAAQNGALLRRQNFTRREFYPLLDRIARCTRCRHSAEEHRHVAKRKVTLAACKACGDCKQWAPDFPRIHFHDLRHTAATLSAAGGVPVVMVAHLLGHVDPTITLRTYQHAFEGGAGDASKRLGELLGNPAPKRQP